MLPVLVGLLVAVGPLLRGSWDLWAQSLLFMAVVSGFCLWLIGRFAIGYMPLPSQRILAWTAVLAVLSWAALSLSPLPIYAAPAWRNLLLGLWIFAIIPIVSKDERAAIDEAIRVCAWILVLLAFYQRYYEHSEPVSALLNRNVFAGTALLLLPLSVQKRDWVLGFALILILFWSRSVGAWLGLAGALMLTRRDRGPVTYWIGAAIGFICLVVIYGKLQSPEVLHRWQWWAAAARMAAARPGFGFGPGTFAYVLPAFQEPGRNLSSLYAHQHFLETAAEYGVVFTLAWCLGLAHFLRRGGAHKRFGALAILIQSLWDYPLSIPANFWLFCYFAASSTPQTSRGVNIAARLKIIYGVLAVALSGGISYMTWQRWEADRLKVRGVELFTEGAPPFESAAFFARSLRLVDDPETERFAAEIELRQVGEGKNLHSALAHLERAAALNPYRASTWVALERLHRRMNNPEAANERRRLGAKFCPVLRLNGVAGVSP
ncbi:MAG: hypothetical protein A3J74_01540 [Elusimicrobia bacterium RIFCSPHIGHO2_02_FULL_57_9]|nr:MAG: hypothetical protein A3J74_01540 [Elusimicrobia bacterium RIFCSPHIGHO2_02_FULL_57_9]